MHVQIITFQLAGIDEEQYHALCDELAPAFAELPGLIAKVWLAGQDGVYGGVYLWHDRQAHEAFTRTDLFAAVAAHPSLTGVTSRDFGVLEEPTVRTHGLVLATP